MEIRNLIHPIRYIRSLITPSCTECKNGVWHGYGNKFGCKCEKYLNYKERGEGIRWKSASVDLVRGTRFCKFEREEVENDG